MFNLMYINKYTKKSQKRQILQSIFKKLLRIFRNLLPYVLRIFRKNNLKKNAFRVCFYIFIIDKRQ